MKTIIFIFILFSIACVTSGLNSRAVATRLICSGADAEREALDKWGGKVLKVQADYTAFGYWIDMINRRGQQKIRFISFVDCDDAP